MNITNLIAFLVSLVLLYFAYDYLVKLETCVCAQQLGVVEQADIEKLKYIEIFMIVLLLLNYFFSFRKNVNITFGTILTLFLLAIYVYFVMHVRRLYMNMPDTCDCSMKFPRYVLYVQAVFMTVALLMWVFIFITMISGILVLSRTIDAIQSGELKANAPAPKTKRPKLKLRSKK